MEVVASTMGRDVSMSSLDSVVPEAIKSRTSSTSSSTSATYESQESDDSRSFSHRLRQRASSVLQQENSHSPSQLSPKLGSKPNDSRLMKHLLLGPHFFDDDIPFPAGPVRKGSDFRLHKEQYSSESHDYIFTVRSREQIVLHFLIELAMLRRDLGLIVFGLFFQWVHSVTTNLAYYYHTRLTAAQRVPLQDVMFEALPELTGAWWMASEYLVYGMIAVVTFCIVANLVLRWRPPHGRPLYCIVILRRMLITLVAAQTLRIISFLITTLPGASHQCLYHVPADMTKDEMINGTAPDRGNPEEWSPPLSWNDILWRVDPTLGCGDLMFSSHTIFTTLFICVVFQYFNWKLLKWFMVSVQLCVIPFILAAHKHYSIDVFTALYVTPLVFGFLLQRIPDMDVTSYDMAKHYGIRFYRGLSGGDVVAVWGHEFFIPPTDVPLDLQEKDEETPLKVLTENNLRQTAEVGPMIV